LPCQLLHSLKAEQEQRWKEYENAKEAVANAWRSSLHSEESGKASEESGQIEDAEKAAAECERRFISSLDATQREMFLRVKGTRNGADYLRFDLTLAQRYIFNRLLELGWTVERFGYFDRELGRMQRGDRGEQVVERMGKSINGLLFMNASLELPITSSGSKTRRRKATRVHGSRSIVTSIHRLS
jgi:hypothetical protein